MSQTFFPIDPVEVTPETKDDWIDVNGADFGVPSGATGVIIHLHNNGSSSLAIGLRKNGSTDDIHTNIRDYSHCWAAIGVDASRIFEAYVGDTTDIDIWLVGYTMSGVTFFTNGYPKTCGAWTDIDCSTEAPDAIGLIFEVSCFFGVPDFGMRKNGSSDNRINVVSYHSCFGVIIGCDASQICEGYRSTTYIVPILVGYITDGATFNTNATDVSLDSAVEWLDLTALPDNSVMGFIEVTISGVIVAVFGLRKNGSAEVIYGWPHRHPHAFVECDASYIIEGYVETTDIDFFVVGYATKPAPPVVGIGAFYQQINPLGLNIYGGWEG